MKAHMKRVIIMLKDHIKSALKTITFTQVYFLCSVNARYTPRL